MIHFYEWVAVKTTSAYRHFTLSKSFCQSSDNKKLQSLKMPTDPCDILSVYINLINLSQLLNKLLDFAEYY